MTQLCLLLCIPKYRCPGIQTFLSYRLGKYGGERTKERGKLGLNGADYMTSLQSGDGPDAKHPQQSWSDLLPPPHTSLLLAR